MEYEIFKSLTKRVERGETVALAMLIKKGGVSPSKPGMLMAVFKDGSIRGTIGGGNLEYQVVMESLLCINSGENRYKLFRANTDEESEIDCASSAEVFIKVFKPDNKLIIVGCGHVGTNLYNVARTQKFQMALFDERKDICNNEKFPEGELFSDDVIESLKNYDIDENTYIVICRHSHEADEAALECVLGRGAGYIGMLGSRAKVQKIKGNLAAKGIPEEYLERVSSPIGIDIGSSAPEQLAIGIMAQILRTKNNVGN